ncbi:helix-turn-helix transcriptional regulator [Mesorhizobium sp. 10J20-29]
MKPLIHTNYDLAAVEQIAHDLRTAIDAASLGTGDWQTVARKLSDAFPGSWAGAQAISYGKNQLNFATAANLDVAYLQSYQKHFAFINPMNGFWATAPSGVAFLSDDVLPWSTLRDTEFYNDWLRPQGDMEGSGGVKIDGDRGESLNLTIRYPAAMAGKYGRAVEAVLQGAAGSLARAVEVGQMLRSSLEHSASVSGLIERSTKAAIVMAADRTILNANAQAQMMFAIGEPIGSRSGRFYLSSGDADTRFDGVLEQLDRGLSSQDGRLLVRTFDALWHVTVTPIPTERENGPQLLHMLRPRRLFLLLVNQIAPSPSHERTSLDALSPLFGLTSSEVALCDALFAGKTVSQAADELGVTVGTARNRLKMVLHKTNTSRQSELILLLHRFK